MPLHQQKSFITVEEYLEGEKDGHACHEYIDGEIYAMTGSSRRHNALMVNLLTLFKNGLKAPCEPFVADMKVRIKTDDRDIFYYPDLSVSCEEEDTDDYYNEHSTLIVEVLSPSTARYDKYEKFSNYRQLPSLQEYVLIHQDIVELWVMRRANQWQKEVYNEGRVALGSVGLTVQIKEIYAGVSV